MSDGRALAIGVFVFSGIMLSLLGLPAVRAWRIVRGTRNRRQQDAHGSAPLATPELAERIEIMRGLGFERLGETFLDLPNTGRRFAWQLAHASHTAYAVIVPAPRIGALIAIYSAWPGGTWLSTMYPIGETADEPDFVVQTVRSSPEAAVALHLERFADLQARLGEARRIETMADVLALDADYRTRHGGRTLVRPSRRIIAPAVVAAAVMAMAFVFLVLSAR